MSLIIGSLEPCHEANPALWQLFCKITKRQNTPVDHWTEQDVVAVIRDRMLRHELG